MIVALWHRWVQSGDARWIFLCGALLVADVFLGAWIVSLWLPALVEAW